MYVFLAFLYVGRKFQISFWLKLVLREPESSVLVLKLTAERQLPYLPSSTPFTRSKLFKLHYSKSLKFGGEIYFKEFCKLMKIKGSFQEPRKDNSYCIER